MRQNKSWGDYYYSSISILEFLSDVLLHISFLIKILRHKKNYMLEVGCGTASHSIFLSFYVEKCIILDCDETVINEAKKNIQKFRRDNISCIRADALYLPFKNKSIGNCFSQGLLEHFNDSDILLLLLEQTRVAERAIFSIPSINYPTIDFGNERLLDVMTWSNILDSNFRNTIINYYPFDLGIRTRISLFKKLNEKNFIKSFIQSIKLPLHIVGEIEN